MPRLVALLRAINVGGTGKLRMPDLVTLCEAAGFRGIRTFIASGNVVFDTRLDPSEARHALENRLRAHAGRAVGVVVRTPAEMASILARNPFPNAPGDRVAVLFLNRDASAADLDAITGQADDEAVLLGERELYVHYGRGIGRSTLRIEAAASGTARNINTVAKLAAMAAEPDCGRDPGTPRRVALRPR